MITAEMMDGQWNNAGNHHTYGPYGGTATNCSNNLYNATI